MEKVRAAVGDTLTEVATRIEENQPLNEEDRASLLGLARTALGVPEDGRDADA
jgi:F-type H+-transporting ATPase subunit alpha